MHENALKIPSKCLKNAYNMPSKMPTKMLIK
jgi:hypothetical protein